MGFLMNLVIRLPLLLLLLKSTASFIVDTCYSSRSWVPTRSRCHHPSRLFQTRNKPSDSKSTSFRSQLPEQEREGIRLNKVFKATHSRRAADDLILSGRVTVNGVPVENKGGFKVIPFLDEVALDGRIIHGWEALNGLIKSSGESEDFDPKTKKKQQHISSLPHLEISPINTDSFEYIKYWKPRGVVCTTDRSIQDNIIDSIIDDGFRPRHRVYPVGRLDKDTSGMYDNEAGYLMSSSIQNAVSLI